MSQMLASLELAQDAAQSSMGCHKNKVPLFCSQDPVNKTEWSPNVRPLKKIKKCRSTKDEEVKYITGMSERHEAKTRQYDC